MAYLKQVLGNKKPRAKLLAAVSPKSSRFLELAPDLEHLGYLQQPDCNVVQWVIILTKNPDGGGPGVCFRINIPTLIKPH